MGKHEGIFSAAGTGFLTRHDFTGIMRSFLLLACLLISIVPIYIMQPADVSAGADQWTVVTTPGSSESKNDILNPLVNGVHTGSEICGMAVGNDATTVAFIVRRIIDSSLANTLAAASPNSGSNTAAGWMACANTARNIFYYSSTSGLDVTITRYYALARTANFPSGANLYQVAIAPDNPQLIAVTSDTGSNTGPKLIWISANAGQNWDLAFDGIGLEASETIRCIDISIDYGGQRDIGFGTVGGTNGGRWCASPSSGTLGWTAQLNANGIAILPLGSVTNSGIGYLAIKFSPTYNGDSSVALVYASGAGLAGGEPLADATYFNVAFRDLTHNTTLSYAYAFTGIEVKNPASAVGASPNWAQLNNVDLELPSDFSGRSSSLRRAYISLDANGFKAIGTCEDGILRVDDTTVYLLMDTTLTADKSIYSIDYFGTYASGKLLLGERVGFPCTATVPTWFTDSPTTCPIPCWYPALKPPTGAAAQGTCAVGVKNGIGAAIVTWNADGSLCYCATGSIAWTSSNAWYTLPAACTANDESALSLTRNNGETWNQVSLIDTTIDWFNDVVPSASGAVLFLASSNRNDGSGCDEFDSVWRSTTDTALASPLPASTPIGQHWERVLCRPTSGNCSTTQSDLPILRCIHSHTGNLEIVGWAAQGAQAATSSGGVMAWSPDSGDFWASITPRNVVQDFCFESSTSMYMVDSIGYIQRLPYTGTAWSTNLPNLDTQLGGAHTITAIPTGKVLVGANAQRNALGPAVSYSSNSGYSWTRVSAKLPSNGNVHVAFDTYFDSNGIIYAGDDNSPTLTSGQPHIAGTNPGAAYRTTVPASAGWTSLMSTSSGASGTDWWPTTPLGSGDPPHRVGQFGIAPANFLFTAHDKITLQSAPAPGSTPVASAVCRTASPRNAMPQPGISWDCLNSYTPSTVGNNAADTVRFTLEPSSLKICGETGAGTIVYLYALDDEAFGTYMGATTGYNPFASPPVRGCLWTYTASGSGAPVTCGVPTLQSPANSATGINPQTVNFSWATVTGATEYMIEITGGNTISQYTSLPSFSVTPLNASSWYTWHVKVTRINGQPVSCAWSSTFSFQTSSGGGGPPPIPEVFYGTATVNGSLAQIGSSVQAKTVDGELLASSAIWQPGSYDNLIINTTVGSTIVFWIVQNGSSYQAEQTQVFQPGQIIRLNLTSSSTISQVISLAAGWNLVSLPVRLVNTAIPAVLAGLPVQPQSIWYYDTNGLWRYYFPGATANTLPTLEDGKAYWIYMPAPSTLTVSGTIPSYSYSLTTGWNMLGFTSTSTKTAGQYLAGADGKYNSVLGYSAGGWRIINSTDYMTPGAGYWINMTQATTLWSAAPPAPYPHPYVGEAAPDFTLACADGSQITLSALHGSKVILNFWALNCSPCLSEMPAFQTVHGKYPNVPVLKVAGPQLGPVNSYAIGSFLLSNNYTFTVPLDETGQASSLYNIATIPRTFFIDSGGIVRRIQDGSFSGPGEIENMLNSY